MITAIQRLPIQAMGFVPSYSALCPAPKTPPPSLLFAPRLRPCRTCSSRQISVSLLVSYVARENFSSVNFPPLLHRDLLGRPSNHVSRRVVSSVVYVALELLVVLLVQFLSSSVRKNFSSVHFFTEIFLVVVLRVARPPPHDELFVWSGKS